MKREDVTKELLDIADTIKELALRKNGIEAELEPLQDSYRELGYDFYTKVCEAVDERGKALYTNEDRRRREVEHRLRNDDKAIKLRVEMRQYREEIDKIMVEVNRLQDRKLILLVTLGAPLPEDVIERENRSKYIA